MKLVEMSSGGLSYNIQNVVAVELQRELPKIDRFPVFDQEIMQLIGGCNVDDSRPSEKLSLCIMIHHYRAILTSL